MRKLSGILFILLGLFACKDKANDDSDDSSFNRQAMLIHYTEQMIRPAFAELKEACDSLNTITENFTAAPSAGTLSLVQQQWLKAFTAFMHVNAYTFGPAAEQGLNKSLTEELATFPVNTSLTENLISSGNTSFDNFNRDTRGFLGMEYLIFDLNGSADTVLKKFQSQNRKNYLLAIARHLQQKVNAVQQGWNTYTAEFISNNGTDAGSSVSLLYNEFLKSFEALKNYKIALPAGKRAGQTQAEPAKVEAYYSGQSIALIREHYKAVQNIWEGRSKSGQDGPGFKEYLAASVGGASLISSTEAQFAQVNNALNQLPAKSFSACIVENPAQVDAVYTEFQKLTRYLKSDMSSILGISITYSSGDGD